VKIALVGQPNSGKSTFFNAVVGYRSLTSNFPGTTVEYARGQARLDGQIVEVVDLPGLYSLTAESPAEVCSREFLLEQDYDVLVNIVDASQLARSLNLTLELLDLEKPLIIALNMMDEAARKGMKVDSRKLAGNLGVPVVEAIATRGQGIVETFRTAVSRSKLKPQPFPYAPQLEAVVSALAADPRCNSADPCHRDLCAVSRGGSGTPASNPRAAGTSVADAARPSARFQALMVLQCSSASLGELDPAAAQAVRVARGAIEEQRGQPADAALAAARHAACLDLFERVVRLSRPHADWREQVDRLLMHPLFGYVFLAAIFLGFFKLVFDAGQFGETRILAFFDQLIAQLGTQLNARSVAFAALKGALLGTAGAVAIVLPYLLPFLVGLAVLEDAGYLARVGYLMDAVMHRIGLHGTATVPLLIGYGCSVPAVMATRILPSRRDRTVAAFLAVLVPCSARMVVILALVGFYLGAYWALGIYAFNLLVVMLAGNVLARVWPEAAPGMLMEVPPYRKPSARVVMLKTWWRLKEFIVIAVPLLIVGSALLGLIEYLGWEMVINTILRPLTWALGLPAAVGLTLIFGVLRKELSLLMLMQALGTTDVGTVMTAGQMIVFTLFVAYYVPCVATLAMLTRELGRRQTAMISATLVALAVAIGLAARAILHSIS
jgi:ferrous iron transport protein B